MQGFGYRGLAVADAVRDTMTESRSNQRICNGCGRFCQCCISQRNGSTKLRRSTERHISHINHYWHRQQDTNHPDR